MAASYDRLRRVLTSLPFLGFLVAVCTWPWPSFSIFPSSGLDLSWGAGLYMAAHDGLVFGQDIVFTYGPLGFLSVPALWFEGLGLVAFAYAVLLHIAACTLVLWAASRIFDRLLAVLVAILACSFLGPPLVVIALIASVSVAAGWVGGRIDRLFPLLAGALAAFAFLVKVNFGVEIVAIAGLALLAPRWRSSLPRIAEFAGALLVSLILLWLLAGEPLGALPDYVSLSSAVISGHSEVMGLTDPGPQFQVLLAVALVAGFAVASWFLNADLERRQRLVLTAMIALFGFFGFKEGFVRQDDAHVGLFTSAVVSAWFVLGWRRGVRWPGVVSLALVLAIATNFQSGSIDPIDRVETAYDQVRTMLSPGKREESIAQGKETILANTGVDPEIVSRMRGATVHVAPYEASIAWALGLDWKPLPVFQDYLAYMPPLDEANADAASSDSGPELILRRSESIAIDSRYPWFNGPKTSLETLCRYDPELIRGEWILLRRNADRCAPERPLREVRGSFGEPIRVPRGPANSVVVARIHGAGVGGLERIRSMLFRAKPRFIELTAQPGAGTPGTFRLVPGTAEDGLVMRAPSGWDYPRPFSVAPNADSFVISGDGMEGEIEVEFLAVPIQPPGGADDGSS